MNIEAPLSIRKTNEREREREEEETKKQN